MPLFSGNPPQYNGYPSPVQPPSLFSKLRQWLNSGREQPRSAAAWNPEYTVNTVTDAGYRRKALRTTHRISEPIYPRPPSQTPFIPPPLPNHSRSRSSGPVWGTQTQHPYPYSSHAIVPTMSYPSKSQQSLDRRHNVYRAREEVYPSKPVHRNNKSYPSQTHTGYSSKKLITSKPRSRSSSPSPRSRREREERHRSHHTRQRDARNANKSSASLPRHHREREERHRDHYVPRRALQDANRSRTKSGSRAHPRIGSGSERHNAPFALVDELIPSVSSYPSIDWNICLPLSSAFKWVGPNTKGSIRFENLAINPPVKEVRIFARKENDALSLVLAKFGPIKVASKDDLTIGHILTEIRNYFYTPLHVREMDTLTADVRNYVSRSYQRRWDSQDKDVMGELWPKLSYWGPIRADMLFSFFQYAGLRMDERFTETRRLYLTLENRWSTRL